MSIRTHVSAGLLDLSLVGPALAEAQLPASRPPDVWDVAALTRKSDFTVFMQKEVHETVRRMALRKLWSLIDLPQSCMELCLEPESTASLPQPAASLVARLVDKRGEQQ